MASATRVGSAIAIGALASWLGVACDVPADEPDAGGEVDAAADAAGVDQGGLDAGGNDRATGHDSAVGRDTRLNDRGPRDLGITAVDSSVAGDAGSGDATPPGVELNPGWIGGACGDVNECNDSTFTTAICETSGFPGGMCTEACSEGATTWYCNDSSGALITTTRCIDANGQPRCASECDFAASPDTGCRPGYTCIMRQRYHAATVFPICLPSSTQGWPGETAPAYDIGAACSAPADCGHAACLLDLPAGYCTKLMCDLAGCPDGSTCFHLLDADSYACLDDCWSAGDCRTGDGYTCAQNLDICWPGSTQEHHPLWNPSVGAADCTTAFAAGLADCDTVPDDYVVMHKSARNMALCASGSLVANFSAGLCESAAVGDKVREGDGKTPEGIFYVAERNDVGATSYYRAFLVSYPDAADAARGLTAGLINQSEHDAIVTAQQNCTPPPQTTDLGSLIKVHGGPDGYGDVSGDSDWTVGCMALDNAHIDRLWSVLDVNDTIVIVP